MASNLLILKNDYLLNEPKKYANERKGILLIMIAYSIYGFGNFYVKMAQSLFPCFETISYIFFRSWIIIGLALISAKSQNEEFITLSKLNHKIWFFIRTSGNFFSVVFGILALWHLRSSTAQIISTLSPIVVTVLSQIFLKEKFYIRYIFGIIMCSIGSCLIILNDRNHISKGHFQGNIYYGVIYGLLSVFLVSIIQIANKILVNNQIPFNSQILYMGLSTFVYSGIYILFSWNMSASLLYIAITFIHGGLSYIAQWLINRGLALADLTKASVAPYISVVVVFMLGFFLLGESIYVSDLLGAGLILSYLLYTTYVPIQIV